MRHVLIFSSLLFLISCGGGGDSIDFPVGSYKSDCIVSDGGSLNLTIAVAEGFKTITTINTIFASADCSGTGTDTEPSVDSGENLVFSNKDLGGGVSYFSDKDEEGTAKYTPFLYKSGKLLIGEEIDDISAGAEKAFAAFITNPTAAATVVLNKQ